MIAEQFRFRKTSSIGMSVFNLTDIIQKNLDHGNFSLGTVVYLSKGFDTIDHEILLNIISLCYVK